MLPDQEGGSGRIKRGRRLRRRCQPNFTDPAESFRLVRWLYTRAWLSSEQPSVLFDLATARLVERQVLLPGVSILARLVVRIRERANTRLYRKLAELPSAEQRDQLKELLVVPAGARRSPMDQLRKGRPSRPRQD